MYQSVIPCHMCEMVLHLPPIGQVTIPGDITFHLDTDQTTDPPVFTLTCTSTGGPATTVSWRRDGTLLTESSSYSTTSQMLLDTETATYNQTLTVTGRLVGQYQCSVSNIRTPSGSSRGLEIASKKCNVSQRRHTCTDYEYHHNALSHPQLLAHPPTSTLCRLVSAVLVSTGPHQPL